MRLLIAVLLTCITGGALAQGSNAEAIAGLGGRVLGAAKACGVDGGRVSRNGEKILSVSKSRAKSSQENSRAVSLFMDAYNAGISEVKSGRTSCSTARAAVADLESKLSRY